MTADISRCIRGDSAPCECVCPFHLDIRAFCDKLRKGSFDGAFNLYRNAVAFPAIVSRLCPAPCRKHCVLKEQAIDLPALEAAAFRCARSKDPLPFRIPPKAKSVAVIGAGPAGLACALRLDSKGYAVHIYDIRSRWGGGLDEELPEDIWEAELAQQFKHSKNYSFFPEHPVHTLEELTEDVVFIATGQGGEDFGLGATADPTTCETERPGVFLGGMLLEADTVRAIASGLRAARYMERFLMTGRMLRQTSESHVEPSGETRLNGTLFSAMETGHIAVPAEGYGKSEAKEEAKRCLRCDCEQCLSRCDFLRYERVQPRLMAERVSGEFISDGKITEGNSRRLVDGCNLCGACGSHCPESIDLGEFLLESKRRLHREEKLPPAWHEFWLRDMAFACSGEAALSLAADGGVNEYVYFPGCQLGASQPLYVSESYRALLAHYPRTALLLSCCGAPALWAGDDGAHARQLAALRKDWEALGRPTAVLACPSCEKFFRRCLPEIPVVSVYELLAKAGLSADAAGSAIFDPCASRGDAALQQSVRRLLPGAAELPTAGDEALCCGYGGQIQVSNPLLHSEIVKKRSALAEESYLCYCSNCRETFAAAGKEARHVFDKLFDLPEHGTPGCSQRRENRRVLKKALLDEFGKETWDMPEKSRLCIDSALRQRLDTELILDDDIRFVIERCEGSGSKLRHAASGHFIGHAALGPITFWVEYAPANEGWQVFNAYSHRLEICEKEH